LVVGAIQALFRKTTHSNLHEIGFNFAKIIEISELLRKKAIILQKNPRYNNFASGISYN
jgi:hypothetical protein